MPKKKETAKPTKFSDVAQPGKTPASATSRPIIVGHPSIMKHDPMVVGDKTNQTSEEQTVRVTRELKLQPDKAETADADDEQSSPTVDETIVEETTQTEEQAATDSTEHESADMAESSGSGVVNTLVNEVDAKQADKKQKEDLEAKTKELEKTIESKEFFVPIGVASRRRSNNLTLISLVVIVVAVLAGINLSIDAELIDIGIQALTDVL